MSTARWEVGGADLRNIAIRSPDERFADGRLIALVPAGYDSSPSPAIQNWKEFPDAPAHALLMAAAPELASLLERYLRIEEEAAPCSSSPLAEASRAALRKAGVR